MKHSITLIACALACAGVTLAGCDSRTHQRGANGVAQTKYPGSVSSGGETAGAIIARSAKPQTDATYAGGTPGHAGGAGGNTGGAEMGGTVRETGQGPSQGVTTPAKNTLGGTPPPGEHSPAPATGERRP